MRIKIQIPNKFYIWLKSEIEKNINFAKGSRKIQKNEDQVWHEK
jgi:hypothetical protein